MCVYAYVYVCILYIGPRAKILILLIFLMISKEIIKTHLSNISISGGTARLVRSYRNLIYIYM